MSNHLLLQPKIMKFLIFEDTPFRNYNIFSVKGNMGVNNIKKHE